MSTTASPMPATDDPRLPGRDRRWQLAWATIAVMAIAVISDGSIRKPTGPDSGTTFSGPSSFDRPAQRLDASAGRRIRVGTFNIHGGRGLDRRRDFGRIAKCLEGLDFVALNEVHGASSSDLSDSAEILGHTLGMAWLFAPAERRWWHDHFGNGALASLPVRWWQRIPLPLHGSKSGRNALLVSLDIDGQPVQALVTHIDRSDPQRSAQLRTIIDLFLALAPPAILFGDLNTTSADPSIQRLLAAPGAIDALSGTSTGHGRIDWIVTRGLKCTASGMHPAGPSDHPQYWAELEMTNGVLGMGNGE
jgi:endonuclease/exonuclease/phosphatase family metal-dependent hydrolase